jgi:YVTN family beta-propeller protein
VKRRGDCIGLALVVTSIGLGGCVLEPPPCGQTPTTEGRPVAPKPAGPTEIPQERTRVYVANESSNSVTAVDARTFEVLATIDARNHATHDLALSRDGRLLLATNLASGRLSLIDTNAMETIGSVYTGERAHVVAFTNDDQQAWIANIAEDNVSILDVGTRRILGTIPTGKGPTGLAFSRDGRFAYVSNQGDKTVAVVDTATLVVVKSIPVGTNPHFLILGPDGRIWGCNTGSNDIYVIDPGTQDVTSLRLMEEIDVGDGPNGMPAAPFSAARWHASGRCPIGP